MTIVDGDFGRAECLDETTDKIENLILLLFNEEGRELWFQKLERRASMNNRLVFENKPILLSRGTPRRKTKTRSDLKTT